MRVVIGDAGEQIVTVAEHVGFRLQADARRDQAGIALAVMAGDEQHRAHAALAIIVRRLQQHGRLAGIHRRVVEVKLGHAALLSRLATPRGGAGAAFP
ncbi:hypothetical protein [Mesorhizobium sp. LNHC209A00]|uniref:hypothetical protein n=1 Tax=Mesorhizobium sp. LNHC209A00 TaxID=1287226 RepID=UPI00041D089A|nr:hypothetical protein [Mesorhizobium sp. LNHC209A00]